ncbi:DedA family protein [Enemella evansiae]|nr:DedA family protein [Enemella evansiae]
MDLSALLQQLTDQIIAMSGSPLVLVVIAALTIIDSFFPPVPSESIVVALAAIAVTSGQPPLWALFLVAAVAAAIGDNIAYQLGRLLHPGGDRGPRWLRGPRMTRTFAWAAQALERRGAVLILVGRHIPVGRVAVNMTAGASGYPLRRFVPLSILAGLAWSAYAVVIGTLAGRWVHDNPLLGAAIAVVVALILGVIVDRVVSAVQGRRDQRRARLTRGVPASNNR